MTLIFYSYTQISFFIYIHFLYWEMAADRCPHIWTPLPKQARHDIILMRTCSHIENRNWWNIEKKQRICYLRCLNVPIQQKQNKSVHMRTSSMMCILQGCTSFLKFPMRTEPFPRTLVTFSVQLIDQWTKHAEDSNREFRKQAQFSISAFPFSCSIILTSPLTQMRIVLPNDCWSCWPLLSINGPLCQHIYMYVCASTLNARLLLQMWNKQIILKYTL